MLIYIARRAAMALSVILTTLVVTFLIFFAGPSDPAQSMCGELRCDQQKLERIRASLRLDEPVSVQFAEYFKGLVNGRTIDNGRGSPKECSAPCLGYSFRSDREVKAEIARTFPTTVALALLTMVVILSVGVTTGVFAAKVRGTRLDRFIVGFSQVFGAIPYYVVALLFALYFTVLYPILPRAAERSDGLIPWVLGMLAPAIVLGLVSSTTYVRYTRAQMIESFNQDYVRTARSKGISERATTYKHALRAALSPVVTILGLEMAGLMSGTLVTERIFGLQGMGNLAITALGGDDLPIIMGTVLVGTVIVVVMNFLVDIAYTFIDPRVRLS